jgi:hypothetical protein
MTQGQAINTINQLLPEISRTRDPEAVLLKHASENNLSPAQLERLGQVFNTAKTISYMEKSASRGGSFKLLDIDHMVSEYMDIDAPQITKSAGTKYVVPSNPFDLPVVWDFEKQAFNVPLDASPTALHTANAIVQAHQYETRQEDAQDTENLIYLKQVLVDEIHRDLHKFASLIYDEPQMYASLEQDSCASPERNANALEHIARVMDEEYRGQYTRTELKKLASYRVARDTTGHLKELERLEESIQLYDKTREIMLEKIAAKYQDFSQLPGGTPPEPPPSEPPTQTFLPGMQDFADTPDPEEPEDPRVAMLQDQLAQAVSLLAARGGAAGTPAPTTPAPAAGADPEMSDEEAEAVFNRDLEGQGDQETRSHDLLMRRLQAAVGKPQGAGKEKEKDPPDGPPPAGPSLLDRYDKGHAAVKGFIDPKFTGAISHLRQVLPTGPKVNANAFARDSARSDVSRAILLQRAIMHDDVLSSSDPQRVASLYNTLYKANPEMMSDENTMIAALREAVQYDGVMPHTYEQFVGTSKQRAETDSKTLENRQKQYTI